MPNVDKAGVNAAGEGERTVDSERAASRTRAGERESRAGREAAEEARSDPAAPARAEELNSIRPARVRRLAPRPTSVLDTESEPPDTRESDEEARRSPASAGKAESDPWTVPQQVRERFLQDGHRFYFRSGELAFRDHGRKLSTPSENTEVIATLIEIARSRGWQEISLDGSERFRKEAWRQGRLAGLAVRGYKPSPAEHAAMIRELSEKEETSEARIPSTPAPAPPDARAPQASEPASQARKRTNDLIAGKLLAHGPDTYRFDPRAQMSYFVRLETDQGQRTIWGKDLQRAIEQSLTKPAIGDEIAMRRTGSDAVTVKRRERDAQGQLRKEEDVRTERHRWVLEKREFFEARAKAADAFRDPGIEPREGVRKHPELVGSYLNLHAAEIAARAMRDPEDRKKFAQLVRHALADSIARGDPLQPVRLREPSPAPPELQREKGAPSDRHPPPDPESPGLARAS